MLSHHLCPWKMHNSLAKKVLKPIQHYLIEGRADYSTQTKTKSFLNEKHIHDFGKVNHAMNLNCKLGNTLQKSRPFAKKYLFLYIVYYYYIRGQSFIIISSPASYGIVKSLEAEMLLERILPTALSLRIKSMLGRSSFSTIEKTKSK